MEMAVKGFTFYLTYADLAADLSPRSQGELYRAIVQYMFYDNDLEATLSRDVRTVYKACKPHLKTSKNRSTNGVEGNNRRWGAQEPIANPSQNVRKTIASLSSRLSSRSNASQTVGSGSVENTDPPVCPVCGAHGVWNRSMSWWECPDCVARLGA